MTLNKRDLRWLQERLDYFFLPPYDDERYLVRERKGKRRVPMPGWEGSAEVEALVLPPNVSPHTPTPSPKDSERG